MTLEVAAARAALAELATALGSASPETAAWGVIQIANATMERAIRKISIERGFDPRDFTLVAFGGAGPVHACELAERLGIPPYNRARRCPPVMPFRTGITGLPPCRKSPPASQVIRLAVSSSRRAAGWRSVA
jgi:hypothetical protein